MRCDNPSTWSPHYRWALFLLPFTLLLSQPLPALASLDLSRAEIDAMVANAQRAIIAGKHQHARILYSRLAYAAPNNVDFHLQLARLQLRRGRPDKAQTRAETAFALAPKNRDVLALLAEVVNIQGHWAKARDYYQQLLQHYPEDAEAYLGLGAALNQLGLAEQADQAWDKARQLTP